ncbi:MAG: 4-hydroxy-3-methylbut-2-enyl diphosphate reductase [Chthonomonadaceae bacterium]|nr:4-hydroxy-3-methylbut-2-enyl diphosphate reductase [Chthonomonadaceae bacterium]
MFQTTLALELCREIVNELTLLCKETNIINTTCRPVQNRQQDALEIAKKVDLMIIVGGRSSHNTQGLAALCRTCNPNTIHVQNADELDYAQYKNCKVVGIASGLSAPEEIVEAVRAKILSSRRQE